MFLKLSRNFLNVDAIATTREAQDGGLTVALVNGDRLQLHGPDAELVLDAVEGETPAPPPPGNGKPKGRDGKGRFTKSARLRETVQR